MKPNLKQKDFIKEVSKQIDFLYTTNDIYSPTHHSDIQEWCEKMEENFGLTEEGTKMLKNLLIIIQKI